MVNTIVIITSDNATCVSLHLLSFHLIRTSIKSSELMVSSWGQINCFLQFAPFLFHKKHNEGNQPPYFLRSTRFFLLGIFYLFDSPFKPFIKRVLAFSRTLPANIPSTLISSSISDQWIPSPSPISS